MKPALRGVGGAPIPPGFLSQAHDWQRRLSDRPRVAIVGSGIAGLAAAHTLRGLANVTLFESGDYFGGHTHTVDVTLPSREDGRLVTFGVDTGFLVMNERTYPQMLGLLSELQVPVAASDMSFSVQSPGAGPGGGMLEWSGTSLNTVFCQRGNLLRPAFWRMLMDMLRFNRQTSELARTGADQGSESPLWQPLGDYLEEQRFSKEFIDWYLLPMLGCIWSCPTDQMLAFPLATLVRFCHNHGLIQVSNRPQWYTVAGGARQYVEKIVSQIGDARLACPVYSVRRDDSGVWITSDDGEEHFDGVILACHTDQSLRILGAAATDGERAVLGSIGYQRNRAVLHTDTSVLPKYRTAWSAWNYERSPHPDQENADVCLHYLINRLQPLPTDHPVVVSLNPRQPIDPAKVIGEYDYAHPVFDLAAIEAQRHLPEIQGLNKTWFAGAWAGYGFHEDGLKSGLRAARELIFAMGLQAPEVPVTERTGVAA